MATLVRPGPRGMWPELFELLESPFTTFRTQQMIRLEEFTEEGRYVLRAELPGIDPEKDVEVTVSDGMLTIHGERKEEEKEGRRTEFRYGSFTRSIALPAGADEYNVTAVYDKGVLEITVGLKEPAETKHTIKVETKE
ncbi:MAG TPA: Hsp20/alpha crystallin family protein [Jiangellaceae bacterium]|nr:Hsp20/alpha crystallin family protein [Jiangellaceae bacterium]